MNVRNLVVIITGGGGGIGLAAARAFASGGANVLITGRRAARLDAITRVEARIESLTADAGNPLDAQRTIAGAVELWGRIDVLVNNAGAGAPMALELAPKGIRVNAVASGPVETDFLEERMGFSHEEAEAVKAQERSMIPVGRRGLPEDVARWILALASKDADWVTGQVFTIDGGFTLV